MTPTLDDLDQRLTAVEERLDEQSGLRASQDRDLSAIAEGVRAHHGAIQALGITQSEHTQKLDQLNGKVDHLTGRVDQLASTADHLVLDVGRIDYKTDHLTGRVDQLEGKVDQITATVAEVQGGVTQIVGMLDTLIAREDER